MNTPLKLVLGAAAAFLALPVSAANAQVFVQGPAIVPPRVVVRAPTVLVPPPPRVVVAPPPVYVAPRPAVVVRPRYRYVRPAPHVYVRPAPYVVTRPRAYVRPAVVAAPVPSYGARVRVRY